MKNFHFLIEVPYETMDIFADDDGCGRGSGGC